MLLLFIVHIFQRCNRMNLKYSPALNDKLINDYVNQVESLDDSMFVNWLYTTYKLRIVIDNFRPVVKFENPQLETLFLIKYSDFI